MTAANFDACLALTLKYEGGLSMIRSDPGNWTGGKVGVGTLLGTKYGIAASAHPGLDIANLTLADAGSIYRHDYWEGIDGDLLPAGVDAVVFDYGVNSGDKRAAEALQGVVGTMVDGKIGQITINHTLAMKASAVVTGVCDARLRFLEGLSSWRSFGGGWARRVGDLRARALVMATGDVTVAENDAKALDQTAVDHQQTASATTKATAASTVAAAGAHATATASNGIGYLAWIITALVVVGAIGAIIMFVKSRAHSDAAAAAHAAVAEIKAAAPTAPQQRKADK